MGISNLFRVSFLFRLAQVLVVIIREMKRGKIRIGLLGWYPCTKIIAHDKRKRPMNARILEQLSEIIRGTRHHEHLMMAERLSSMATDIWLRNTLLLAHGLMFSSGVRDECKTRDSMCVHLSTHATLLIGDMFSSSSLIDRLFPLSLMKHRLTILLVHRRRYYSPSLL